ncbi:MAG TPA: FmdB family zinc ribbon protein [Actinophytocola sp.]|uniref:FmdB family zinc ribbon protein n=1 Tax=Actinophytocola sp. TaxID=1872138 RepID=UPI002DDD399A|nr:FmdB family zinc ribbon protein [Actinophytocola sp.]HEV2782170.1 FmdB family zinc ribbon protein [Actinophytocola sp.]
MPTYQYACTACDHRFEKVQSFTDAALTECPECAGRLRKLYGSVGVVFKGSGFYRTDSRAKSEAKSASSPSSDGGSGGAKESSSSGDKPSTNSSSSSTGTTKPIAKAS